MEIQKNIGESLNLRFTKSFCKIIIIEIFELNPA